MKKMTLLFMALFVLMSCAAIDPIVGSWSCTFPWKATYIFAADKTCSSSGTDLWGTPFAESGTYTSDGGNLSITWSDASALEARYTISGNSMTWYPSTGGLPLTLSRT